MSAPQDQLFELLPAVVRMRDADQDYPLRSLLRVMNEQFQAIQDDIGQLYENWFIETCQDWVVPYIGDLVGFRRVEDAGEPGDATDATGQQLNRFLYPRREIANTVRHRRRKGTVSILEDLAFDVAGWRGRAVELFKLVSFFQSVRFPLPEFGRTVDVRHQAALDRLHSPFERVARTVDVRHIGSTTNDGWYNLPNVALFTWQRNSYPLSIATPKCHDTNKGQCRVRYYTFNRLGLAGPLFVNPQRESDPHGIAEEIHLPMPLRRYLLRGPDGKASPDFYGRDKSVSVWVRKWKGSPADQFRMIPANRVVVCDLNCFDKQWESQKKKLDSNQIAIDPECGRIVFPKRTQPEDVRVSYHYSFSAEMGGGEYRRQLPINSEYPIHRVVPNPTVVQHAASYDITNDLRSHLVGKGKQSEPPNAVLQVKSNIGFEFGTSESFHIDTPLTIEVMDKVTLELRSSNGKRASLEIGGNTKQCDDTLTIRLGKESRLILDGLLVSGQSLKIEDKPKKGKKRAQASNVESTQRNPREVVIRHCTFVPSGSVGDACHQCQDWHPSLCLQLSDARVCVSKSILGAIVVDGKECCDVVKKTVDRPQTPIEMIVRDSILDNQKGPVLQSHCCTSAHADLTIRRSTVLGCPEGLLMQVDRISAAEDCILDGKVIVDRVQHGYLRFCYLPTKIGERTPRRFKCQPETSQRKSTEDCGSSSPCAPLTDDGNTEPHTPSSTTPLRPIFVSPKYGNAGYCQLTLQCPEEISRGAESESEMGAFHNNYTPQRDAMLRARIEEFTPADMHSAVIYADEIPPVATIQEKCQ